MLCPPRPISKTFANLRFFLNQSNTIGAKTIHFNVFHAIAWHLYIHIENQIGGVYKRCHFKQKMISCVCHVTTPCLHLLKAHNANYLAIRILAHIADSLCVLIYSWQAMQALTPIFPSKSSWLPRCLAHLRLQLRRAAAQDFQEAVNLVGVPAEAGQQEMEVGQFGDLVLADVIASSVGQ